MRRLICAFVVRIWHETHFLMARLKCYWNILTQSYTCTCTVQRRHEPCVRLDKYSSEKKKERKTLIGFNGQMTSSGWLIDTQLDILTIYLSILRNPQYVECYAKVMRHCYIKFAGPSSRKRENIVIMHLLQDHPIIYWFKKCEMLSLILLSTFLG